MPLDKYCFDVKSAVSGFVNGFLQIVPFVGRSDFEKASYQWFTASEITKSSQLGSLICAALAFSGHQKGSHETFLALYQHAKESLDADKTAAGPLKTIWVYFIVSNVLFLSHLFF